jgi:hypothetical protein
MFGGVLRASGIGQALAGSLDALGLPLIVAAFHGAAGRAGFGDRGADHHRGFSRADGCGVDIALDPRTQIREGLRGLALTSNLDSD